MRTSSGQELIQAIRRLANGCHYVDGALQERLVAAYVGETKRPSIVRNGDLSLTNRERQVFEFVVAGRTSRSVAAALGLSKRTIDQHRAAISTKTGARTRADLVRLAKHLGCRTPAHPALESTLALRAATQIGKTVDR